MVDLMGRPDEELDALATQLGVDAIVLYDWPKGQKRLSLALYVIHHGLFGQPVPITLSQSKRPTKKQLQTAVTSLTEMLLGRKKQPQTALEASKPGAAPVSQPTAKSQAEKSRLRPIATSEKEQAQQAALSGLDQKQKRDDGTALPIIAEVPWYNSWWFWTASSIFLAGALTTGLVLGLSEDTGPSGKVILTVNPP